MIKISTSILSSDDRIDSIEKLNNTNTDYIHIDVMDNKFVPNYQFPVDEVNNLSAYSMKLFDIHLMIEDPEPFIKELLLDNVLSITIHVEISKNIPTLIKLIKSYGYQVGLAIKPNTNPNVLDKYINEIDKVIIMSVEPGFGGQEFLPSSIRMIKEIRQKRNDIIIEVDGGINDKTIKYLKDITDIAVVGSYIVKKENYQEAINTLKN